MPEEGGRRTGLTHRSPPAAIQPRPRTVRRDDRTSVIDRCAVWAGRGVLNVILLVARRSSRRTVLSRSVLNWGRTTSLSADPEENSPTAQSRPLGTANFVEPWTKLLLSVSRKQ